MSEKMSLASVLYKNGNKSKLEVKFNTGSKNYAYYYEKQGLFKEKRYKNNKILEIGVDAYRGATSVKAWSEYFPNSQIYGIDVFTENANLGIERVKTFIGFQQNKEFLDKVIDEAKDFDIIIDDGSHYNADIIISFEHLWPHVNPGGIYIIEDIHCTENETNKFYQKSMPNLANQIVSREEFNEWILEKIRSIHYDPNYGIEDICFIANGIIIKKLNDVETLKLDAQYYSKALTEI